ncbi:MAG: TetR/AcrR family transcriptional regulator [Deinococcus sp.]|uniref:TetR/AcrR family transcriptional regulator n=1 Tax=Deinococcus sp. TaxID=47478 RepID=UPI0026DD79C6|nr:TetR/AcrR family transcriptional regulator [Deinococcus sp.]MDO4245441.1 TetR/AcrR family transcriptional regulator [Deinococcus sp.]
MARPRTIPDERLLEAAREVFLEQGFSATTAAIARRAEVSEGTLFKRFATKEDLFEAAMGLDEYARWREDLLAQVGQGEVRRNLERAALAHIDEARRILPHLTAVFARGCSPEHNPLLERLDNPLRQDTDALARYLREETALGRVRPHDTEVVALCIVGAIGQFIHREYLFAPGPPGGAMDSGRFVRGLLDLLWPGLKP